MQEPRLTDEQSRQVLDAALRMQQRHDATLGIDELAQAAAEAGIDPRFVREAALRAANAPPVAASRPWGSVIGWGFVFFMLGTLPAMPAVQQRLTSLALWVPTLALAAFAGFSLGRRAPVAVVPAVGTTAYLLGTVVMGLLMKSAGFYLFAPSTVMASHLLAVGLAAWASAFWGRSRAERRSAEASVQALIR